jgi:hypothetical protein
MAAFKGYTELIAGSVAGLVNELQTSTWPQCVQISIA